MFKDIVCNEKQFIQVIDSYGNSNLNVKFLQFICCLCLAM